MRKLIDNNFTKGFVVIIALIIMSAGFCSMSAMKHDMENNNCMEVMMSGSSCGPAQQNEACINFHFGLLQKFSHSFADNLGFKFIFSILTLAVLFYISGSLLKTLLRHTEIPKVRLRQLFEETITVFQDSLGRWLSILEKRDPSYAFAIA